MTKEQLQTALASKQALQSILDRRFNALNSMSDDFQSAGRLTDSLIIGNRAEIYNALGLICATEIGMYSSMLLQMAMKKEQNNEA